jgi:hypothetical protein
MEDTLHMARYVRFLFSIPLALAFMNSFVGVAEAESQQAVQPEKIEDDELKVGRADQYSVVVDRAVGCLVGGDAACFRAMLSEQTVQSESRQKGAVDAIISGRFIPFFKDFARLTDTVSTLATHDQANYPGLAIFRTFETRSGQEKPFVIYVINQRGNFVVGNLLLNVTLEDAVAQQGSHASPASSTAK